MTTEELKLMIDANIRENGVQEITGSVLNRVLNAIAENFNEKGKYPSLTSGFANNLVGRGEAIESVIGFRPSGGKSIEDGAARVKELLGNTIVVDGEFLSCKATGIKSVGFNAWDEEWEQGYINEQGENGYAEVEIRSKNYIPVLSNTAYYFPYYLADKYGQSGSLYFRVMFYDNNKNVIEYRTTYTNWAESSWIMTTPANCAYIRFYTNIGNGKYNGDICINISHTGYRNGEYQPYMQFIREFDRRIMAEFPNGIRAFDKVYNKNGKGYILKGTGEVDMGNLSWGYFNGAFYAAVSNKANGRFGYSDIIAEYYTAVSGGGSQAGQNGNIWSESGTTNVYVKDASYTDVANFTRAMQGITLYYELAEPEILEFEEPFNLDYEVWDFGTEEMLTSEASAPIRGLIAYGFNAVDEIRELRQMLTTLQTQIANL